MAKKDFYLVALSIMHLKGITGSCVEDASCGCIWATAQELVDKLHFAKKSMSNPFKKLVNMRASVAWVCNVVCQRAARPTPDFPPSLVLPS